MVVSPNSPWNNALALIRANVTEQVYNTWFQKIVFESFNDATKTVLLQVPSPYVCEYVEENYVQLLGKALRENFCDDVRLQYRVVTDKEHGIGTTMASEPETDGMPTGGVKPRTLARQAQPVQQPQPVEFDSQLNPTQTFDNYIEGVCNKLPRSVGESLAEHPDTAQFNPFFIYGPSGSGKTHLINAIGVRTKQLHPEKRVLYLSARTFEVQYTTAQMQNNINDFNKF